MLCRYHSLPSRCKEALMWILDQDRIGATLNSFESSPLRLDVGAQSLWSFVQIFAVLPVQLVVDGVEVAIYLGSLLTQQQH